MLNSTLHSESHSSNILFQSSVVKAYLERVSARQTAHRENQNEFTISMMRLLHKLAEFGFLGSIREVRDMAKPLITCLDGRRDRDVPQEMASERRPSLNKVLNREGWGNNDANPTKQQQADALVNWVRSDRYEKHEKNTKLMEGRMHMCRVLLTVADMRAVRNNT